MLNQADGEIVVDPLLRAAERDTEDEFRVSTEEGAGDGRAVAGKVQWIPARADRTRHKRAEDSP